MKKILYIFMASVCILATGCIGGEDIGFDDDWNAPEAMPRTATMTSRTKTS